jgi:hypothetical protein
MTQVQAVYAVQAQTATYAQRMAKGCSHKDPTHTHTHILRVLLLIAVGAQPVTGSHLHTSLLKCLAVADVEAGAAEAAGR